jgi:hypothetical protein
VKRGGSAEAPQYGALPTSAGVNRRKAPRCRLHIGRRDRRLGFAGSGQTFVHSCHRALSVMERDKYPLRTREPFGRLSLRSTAAGCVRLLQEAKNKIKHGEWSKWLKLNCPNIPARTATDYMKLAEQQARISPNRQRAADLSIRGALRAIKPQPEPKTRQKPKKSKPDLEALLHDLAPDELLTALEAARWDAEKLMTLAHCIVNKLGPLAATWPGRQDDTRKGG